MLPVFKHGNDVRIMFKKLNEFYMTFYIICLHVKREGFHHNK
jgi:hypothetical protein